MEEEHMPQTDLFLVAFDAAELCSEWWMERTFCWDAIFAYGAKSVRTRSRCRLGFLQIVDGAILVLISTIVGEDIFKGSTVGEERHTLHLEQWLAKRELQARAFFGGRHGCTYGLMDAGNLEAELLACKANDSCRGILIFESGDQVDGQVDVFDGKGPVICAKNTGDEIRECVGVHIQQMLNFGRWEYCRESI